MIPRTRPDACLSDFALDCHLGGELGETEAALARDHLASCARCESRERELRAERESFTLQAPALKLPEPRLPRKRRKGVFAGAGIIAAAAVAGVLLRAPEGEPGTRTKGDRWRFGFYVSHAGAVREGGPGERVEPGDALRFTYGAEEARYVAVLSVDGSRRASTYYPASGAVHLEAPGAMVPLPLSTILDDTLGEETIYGVACAQPFDVEALREALQRAPDRPPIVPGCDVARIVLHKEARLPL